MQRAVVGIDRDRQPARRWTQTRHIVAQIRPRRTPPHRAGDRAEHCPRAERPGASFYCTASNVRRVADATGSRHPPRRRPAVEGKRHRRSGKTVRARRRGTSERAQAASVRLPVTCPRAASTTSRGVSMTIFDSAGRGLIRPGHLRPPRFDETRGPPPSARTQLEPRSRPQAFRNESRARGEELTGPLAGDRFVVLDDLPFPSPPTRH